MPTGALVFHQLHGLKDRIWTYHFHQAPLKCGLSSLPLHVWHRVGESGQEFDVTSCRSKGQDSCFHRQALSTKEVLPMSPAKPSVPMSALPVPLGVSITSLCVYLCFSLNRVLGLLKLLLSIPGPSWMQTFSKNTQRLCSLLCMAPSSLTETPSVCACVSGTILLSPFTSCLCLTTL